MRLFFSKHELKLRRKENHCCYNLCGSCVGRVLDVDPTSEGYAGNADSHC